MIPLFLGLCLGFIGGCFGALAILWWTARRLQPCDFCGQLAVVRRVRHKAGVLNLDENGEPARPSGIYRMCVTCYNQKCGANRG